MRLYCKYFGGSIALVPMEGYGTDCYVTFNRLGKDNAEQLSPSRVHHTGEATSGGIFDAQSRRGYTA